MSETVSVRSLGPVEVAVVHAGRIHWNPHFADGQDWRPTAETDDEGRAVLGINGLVVRTPDALVVVDPNSFEPGEQLGGGSLVVGPPIEAALDELGVDPRDVTHVAITHGHADHFSALLEDGKPRFPSAEILFPAADFDTAGDEVRATLEAAGTLRLVEGDVDVAPGVTLLSAPGETPGHQVVRVERDGERVYYLGDLVHFPAEVDHLDWVAVSRRDVPALVESRRRIFADPGGARATFVFTHGRFPAWGTIAAAGDGWTWRYD